MAELTRGRESEKKRLHDPLTQTKTTMSVGVIVLVALVALLDTCWAYIPGVAPVEFDDGDEVELKVNKLISVHTQVSPSLSLLSLCLSLCICVCERDKEKKRSWKKKAFATFAPCLKKLVRCGRRLTCRACFVCLCVSCVLIPR
jgi:hypothetical protein